MPREVYATCEPASRDHSRYLAKCSFVEAIQRCTPKVLDDLSAKPFQIFSDANFHLFNQNGSVTFHYLDTDNLNKVMPEICDCLLKHNIHVEWLHDFVLLTFQEWKRNPNLKWPKCRESGEIAWWGTGVTTQIAIPEEERLFHFEHQFLDPTCFPYDRKKDREALEKEITRKFQHKLKDHFDRLQRIPEGFVPVKTKDSQQHFEWLVLYLIEGLTHPQIVERYENKDELNTQAIGKAIRHVAQQVEIVLPNRKGKPKQNLENCEKRFL